MATRSGGKKELDDYIINVVCKQACEFLANELYEAVNFFLAQYYSEWHPSKYQRQFDLLHSAFKTTVKRVGNSYQAVVGIDYESLDDYKDVSGWQVVKYANEETHGGLNVDTHTRVFDDAVDATITSGQLLKDCIAFLRGKGYTIIT